MMPGTKRKLRLLTDWNVQLLFGRDGSELGRLGHPPRLEQPSGGGTPSGMHAAEAAGTDAATQDDPAGA